MISPVTLLKKAQHAVSIRRQRQHHPYAISIAHFEYIHDSPPGSVHPTWSFSLQQSNKLARNMKGEKTRRHIELTSTCSHPPFRIQNAYV